MNMKAVAAIFVWTTLLALFGLSAGAGDGDGDETLSCFECNSKDHTACSDPFDEKRAMAASFLTTCPEPTGPGYRKLCRKTHQTVRTVVRVVRGCGYANSSAECTGSRNREVIVSSCQCFKNKCNAASVAQAAPAVLLLLAAALRAI